MAKQNYERQQTGKELAVTGVLMLIGIILVMYGEGQPFEYAKKTLCINAVGIVVGIIAVLYQRYCMHTPLKEDKKEEEQQDGE